MYDSGILEKEPWKDAAVCERGGYVEKFPYG